MLEGILVHSKAIPVTPDLNAHPKTQYEDQSVDSGAVSIFIVSYAEEIFNLRAARSHIYLFIYLFKLPAQNDPKPSSL